MWPGSWVDPDLLPCGHACHPLGLVQSLPGRHNTGFREPETVLPPSSSSVTHLPESSAHDHLITCCPGKAGLVSPLPPLRRVKVLGIKVLGGQGTGRVKVLGVKVLGGQGPRGQGPGG